MKRPQTIIASYSISAALSAVALLTSACGDNTEAPVVWDPPEVAELQPVQLTDLGIEITESRPFVYTNKVAGYFYGEAAAPHRTGWQGFNIRGFTFMDAWHWTVGDTALGSNGFDGATIYPDHALRQYEGGLSERITLLDGKNVLLIEPALDGALSGELMLQPLLSDGRSAEFYDTQVVDGALVVARQNRKERASEGEPPVWMAIKGLGAQAEVAPAVVEFGGAKPTLFAPGAISMDLSGAEPAAVAVAVADTIADAVALADDALESRDAYRQSRAERMETLITDSYVVTEDDNFNRAMAWTRISMDALVMNQRGMGIFAGLPWFNNYWGRDTFIALPGAMLVTGAFEEAREILTSFASFQDTDESSANYGRIPNFVNLQSVSYNTADGTPWFVSQAAAYVAHSGDTAFVEEIWPVVEHATEGNLRRVDDDGFLRHGDQETWMDAAAGEGNEWSPRGDRAVEIQGLWYQQLHVAADMAERLGHSVQAARYREHADKLAETFVERYYDGERGMLIDHFDADDNADEQIRPNQFFALRAFDMPFATERAITRQAAERLVYAYGVSSLNQEDDGFHPYHEAPSLYPKDSAYHNGTIWTWLTGPLVSLMVEQGGAEQAYEQIEYLSRLCLERGAAGAIAENQDALPKDEATEPTLTGTVLQAWSHSEYLRNVYQDFAGVRYESFDRVVLAPNLPSAWGTTQTRIRMGDGHVRVTMRREISQLYIALTGQGDLPAGARVVVAAMGQRREVAVAAGRSSEMLVRAYEVLVDDGNGAAASDDDDIVVDGVYDRDVDYSAAFWDDFAWQSPVLREDLPALQGPSWPLLERADIKAPAEADASVVLEVVDPVGDDLGENGSYLYPVHSAFEPGMLDLIGVDMLEDKDAYHFTLRFDHLVQPGWNPPYGFQLTFAALLFDTGAGGTTKVERNANYLMPDGKGYEYALFVGGGMMLQDTYNNTLMEYRPADGDVVDPLGSVDTASITFRLPKTIFPALPDGTEVTILVGSQDDHGGGGMGEFRHVAVGEAQEWSGGGKDTSAQANVYDVATGIIEIAQ